jgi:methylated-DNA-protein-cysteine methyltransferase-like protein
MWQLFKPAVFEYLIPGDGEPLLSASPPAGLKYNCPMSENKLYSCFYEVIQKIPPGSVATYGQIAEMAGYPGYARQVGYALRATPKDLEIPWHRVINAKGMISIQSDSPYDNVQRLMLEAEGIQFDERDRVPLRKYRWQPGK